MRQSIVSLTTAFLGFALAGSVHADILAGRFGASGTTEFNVVAIFGDTMNGNTQPLSLLGGPATGINTANTIVYDPVERTLLLSDFFGQKVFVFDAATRLNTAPLRSFSSPLMGQVRKTVPITAHNEYAVINFAFIGYFPQNATGETAPIRSTSFMPNLINNLGGLIYQPETDQVAVGDYAELGGGQFEGEVLFFARTDSGAAVPVRRIGGNLTQLGNFVLELDRNPDNGEIYVLAADSGAGASTGRLLTFAANANGNVAPIRAISGPATLLRDVSRLSYYGLRDELLVTCDAFAGGQPRLLGFPRAANGNVAPTRDITGPNTGVTAGNGWYGVVGVPLELIFENDFE